MPHCDCLCRSGACPTLPDSSLLFTCPSLPLPISLLIHLSHPRSLIALQIGQQFSTRVDVLSQEFVKELEKLQDNVPPFDSETALKIVENNLGDKPSALFKTFEETPIAAASLGQVHLATLKTGEKVVVKVQRPGLKELFDIDLKNIRTLAVWLQKVDPKTDGAARDWVAIYDECSRILYQEIDYRGEATNAQQFADNFKDVPWVKVSWVAGKEGEREGQAGRLMGGGLVVVGELAGLLKGVLLSSLSVREWILNKG
jgi:hypothetical protein